MLRISDTKPLRYFGYLLKFLCPTVIGSTNRYFHNFNLNVCHINCTSQKHNIIIVYASCNELFNNKLPISIVIGIIS